MDIECLIESLRVAHKDGLVNVYGIDRHAFRLFKSINELSFKLKPGLEEAEVFVFWFLNKVKELLQYEFKTGNINFVIASEAKQSSQPIDSNSSGSPRHYVPRDDGYKLRFLYKKDGKFELKLKAYTRDLEKPWKIKVLSKDEFHIDSQDPKWRHKFFPREAFQFPYEEVIWTNEKGHICEGSFTNIFWVKDDKWYTPSLECNILPGVIRSNILELREVEEGFYTIEDLNKADQIYLSNSMIGLKPVALGS